MCTGQPLVPNLAIVIFGLAFKILNITYMSEVPGFLPQLLSPLLTSEMFNPEFSVYQSLMSFTLNTNVYIMLQNTLADF